MAVEGDSDPLENDEATRFVPRAVPPAPAPPPAPEAFWPEAPSEPAAPDPEIEQATRIAQPMRPPAGTATTSAATSIATIAAPAAGQESTIAIGAVLGHTYVIEAFLARGGMGEVYRARHQEMGSIHAIKVILPELTRDQGVITMFTEEARKLRRVREDGVVAYEGMFLDEAGRRYLVMEFADGPSLNKVLRERKLSVEEVRQLRDRMSRGLHAAHEKGFSTAIYPPDNVILVNGKTEQAKVIDFGIAKSTEAGEKTVVGNDFAGKFSWVAPEQLGLYGGKIDARTDIYSLGLILASASIGKTLTPCASMAEVVMTRQKVPDLARVPEALRAELEPLLRPDPADRPASMLDLPGSSHKKAADLALAKPAAKPAGPPMALIGGGIAAVLAVAGVAGYFMLGLQSPKPVVQQQAETQPARPKADPAQVIAALGSTVGGLECASVKLESAGGNSILLEGFVKSAADKAMLNDAAGQAGQGLAVVDQIGVVPWPFCEARRIGPLFGTASDLAIQVDHPDTTYRIGESFMVNALPPAGIAKGWIAVDLIDSEGNVGHMVPGPGSDGTFTAGRAIHIGAPPGQPGAWVASDPPGPMMIFAVASDHPIDRPRQPVEDAKSYFQWLTETLRRNGGKLSSSYVAVTVVK